jgi:hypothetical protein
MDDDTPEIRPQSTNVGPTPGPTEAELSRIARQAVRQPADARLDKQLARMGLLEASEPAGPKPGQPTGGSVVIDPDLERLRKELRRTRLILWVLVAATLVLAVIVVVLLIR